MRFSISVRDSLPDAAEWKEVWEPYVTPTEKRVYEELFDAGSEGDTESIARRLGLRANRVLTLLRRLEVVGLIKIEDD